MKAQRQQKFIHMYRKKANDKIKNPMDDFFE